MSHVTCIDDSFNESSLTHTRVISYIYTRTPHSYDDEMMSYTSVSNDLTHIHESSHTHTQTLLIHTMMT